VLGPPVHAREGDRHELAAGPLGSFEGTSLERFAADDLSDQLVRAGAGRVVVAARRAIQQAEVSLGWRSDDPLRFDRLQALARAIGADRLVVGWITLLTVESGGSDDGGPPVAEASVVIQGAPVDRRTICHIRPAYLTVSPTWTDSQNAIGTSYGEPSTAIA
jgi:hypothetical protein